MACWCLIATNSSAILRVKILCSYAQCKNRYWWLCDIHAVLEQYRGELQFYFCITHCCPFRIFLFLCLSPGIPGSVSRGWHVMTLLRWRSLASAIDLPASPPVHFTMLVNQVRLGPPLLLTSIRPFCTQRHKQNNT